MSETNSIRHLRQELSVLLSTRERGKLSQFDSIRGRTVAHRLALFFEALELKA
ncbi:MAG TPA: hypothetical protein VMH81_02080 [Bryobacteraceae bacterium]|nr:hypothetical protein [Bryobacteraceae bacterium]